jgi:hypothetical protein
MHRPDFRIKAIVTDQSYANINAILDALHLEPLS